MMNHIPFYENLKDDTHCVQAALKMVLGFFDPERVYTFAELNEITAHEEGKWTWQYAMSDWLGKNGFVVVAIEDFDTNAFVDDGEGYLEKHWTPEVYEIQKHYSNFSAEKTFAERALKNKNVTLTSRPATIDDVLDYFSQGYVVMVSINPNILNDGEGYASHVVVVTNIDEEHITFHDPGLPPIAFREVSITDFKSAMGASTASVIAIKKK